jgi:putative DNA primase/helicase
VARRARITNVGFDPKAEAPRWLRFLEEVLPDPEVRQYIQRLLGSCLTGVAEDRSLTLLVGTGHNGKGAMIEAIAYIMGDYSHAVSQRFVARRYSDPVPPHELAMLPGRRFVYGAELKKEMPMDVEMIKSLTGGDTMQACHKYQSPFNFKPKCKIVVSANHRPPIQDQTASIWDRLRIVKFPNQFERGQNRDNQLPSKLRYEGSGILNWMLAGAMEWQQHGLGSAVMIDLETEDERRSQDPLDDFFTDVAVILKEGKVSVGDLYSAYQDWADKEGFKRPWTKSKFSRMLQDRPGIEQKRTASKRMWLGIALRDERGNPRKQDMPSQQVIDRLVNDHMPPPEDDGDSY